MKKLELAIELIKEKSDPDGKCTMSKRMLAKVLRERYPSEFYSEEQSRLAVRSATGAQGKQNRKNIKFRR